MLIKYINDVSPNKDTLTLNQNYIVYAYEEHNSRQQYWILNDQQEFINLFSEHIELLDATHSKQWKMIKNTRAGCTCYVPSEWVKEIPSEYYNNRIDEIEGFWESYDDIYGSSCSHMSMANDCTYIEEMKKEFPDYELRPYHDLQTKILGLDIGEGWVMCPRCDEAFKVDKKREIIFCPSKHCGIFMKNPYLLRPIYTII